jgi:dTDP-glucose 4,6-dehydratase
MENRLSQDLEHVLSHTEQLWADLRGERVFITGGTGFVGSWLLESLLWANRRLDLGVRCTVLTRDPSGFRARRPHLACNEAVALLAGDATFFSSPSGCFPFIVHAASGTYRPPTPESLVDWFDRDLEATRTVLEFARICGAARLLFTSSGSVYGRQPGQMAGIPEDYAGAVFPNDVNAAYGHAKRTSEFLCASYARAYGFDAAIARLFAFSGPYLPLDGQYAIGNFIADALCGRPLHISGDGTPYRSYLYAADMAIWLWTILLRGQSGSPYNVGSPHAVSIAELAAAVRNTVAEGVEIRIAQAPRQRAEASRYVPAVERAECQLGLKVWIPLEEGIRRMWSWHAASMETARHEELRPTQQEHSDYRRHRIIRTEVRGSPAPRV